MHASTSGENLNPYTIHFYIETVIGELETVMAKRHPKEKKPKAKTEKEKRKEKEKEREREKEKKKV